MTSIKKLAQLVGLGFATMGLVACGGGGSTDGSRNLTTQSGTGLMSLAVTDDAIEDAKHVWIEFTHIELQPADDDERVVICLDKDPAYLLPEEETSCPLPGEPREIDLLALQGEDSEFLFEGVEVPAGDYDWIRFYLKPDDGPSSPPLTNFLTSSYIVFEDGRPDAQLIIPGGLQAGLQLVSGFTVPEGGSASFTVDFDLRNMIQPTDEFGGGYYRMRRALRLVDNSKVGVITGTVDPGLFPPEYTCNAAPDDENVLTCPGLFVAVYEDGTSTDPLTTANVEGSSATYEYRYTVGFLSPGAYDLKLTLDEAILDEANGENVVAGEKKVVNFPSTD
jgi:hypothetical protein